MTVCAVGLAVALSATRASRTNESYLRPVTKPNNPISAAYEKEWRSLLIVTPGEIARVSILPAFAPEASAAITGAPDGAAPYRLTCTRATKSIWHSGYHEREIGHPPMPVPIERLEVPLTADTALAVRGAWIAMLHRPLRRPSELGLDGVGYEFSARDRYPGAEAVGAAWSPRPGRVADMATIGQLLLDYCQADGASRSRLDRDISALATEVGRKSWLERLTIGWSGREQ